MEAGPLKRVSTSTAPYLANFSVRAFRQLQFYSKSPNISFANIKFVVILYFSASNIYLAVEPILCFSSEKLLHKLMQTGRHVVHY